jgi:hypothetical protein
MENSGGKIAARSLFAIKKVEISNCRKIEYVLST